MRRLLLVMSVAALMAAMVTVTAVPAFAQAVVTPKQCSEHEFEDVSERYCFHDVQTPSGNNNGHYTYDISYPGVDDRFKGDYHYKPAKLSKV